MEKSFVEKYEKKVEGYKNWGKNYKEYEEATKGVPCRKFKFSIVGGDILTDGDFNFDDVGIDFSGMADVMEEFEDKYYAQTHTYGLWLNAPFYANKMKFLSSLRINDVSRHEDCDYEIPKFEMEYLMYDSDKVCNDLRPLLEFAQCVCWIMIKSIKGRFSDIKGYIEFFAGIIKELEADNFCRIVLGEKRKFNDFHPIAKTFGFGGNAEGYIHVCLEEVKE